MFLVTYGWRVLPHSHKRTKWCSHTLTRFIIFTLALGLRPESTVTKPCSYFPANDLEWRIGFSLGGDGLFSPLHGHNSVHAGSFQTLVMKTGAESVLSWPHVPPHKSSACAAAIESNDSWSGIRKLLCLWWLWCLALGEQFFSWVMGKPSSWAEARGGREIKAFLPSAVPS